MIIRRPIFAVLRTRLRIWARRLVIVTAVVWDPSREFFSLIRNRTVQRMTCCQISIDNAVHFEFLGPYFKETPSFWCGPGSVVSIATAYGLDGPGIESRCGEIFRTSPDRPWGPPSLLCNGYRVFPGGKVLPGRDADPSHPSSAAV